MMISTCQASRIALPCASLDELLSLGTQEFSQRFKRLLRFNKLYLSTEDPLCSPPACKTESSTNAQLVVLRPSAFVTSGMKSQGMAEEDVKLRRDGRKRQKLHDCT